MNDKDLKYVDASAAEKNESEMSQTGGFILSLQNIITNNCKGLTTPMKL